MTIAPRFATCLVVLLLAAPVARADSQAAPMSETGTHAWTNPGKVLPCDFRSGTLTATGLIHSQGCDPSRDTTCGLVLEVVSIKEDSVRGFLAHDPDASRCTIEIEDGRKRVLGQLWSRSKGGEQLVRLTGVVTDGVMGVSRFRLLGPAADHR
jgi:hypothetical protein